LDDVRSFFILIVTLEKPLNFVPTNPPATPLLTQTLPHHIIVLLKKRGREIQKISRKILFEMGTGKENAP
jgi:hypothetical protein